MKMSGRTILITGGSSGIGLELAKQLLARGNVVIVTGRKDTGLEQARQRHPGLHTFKSDVSEPEEIRALTEIVLARFPTLDTLINNAGIMRVLKLREDRSLDEVTREIDVNLNGPIRMIQSFMPHFSSQPEAMIVNVSSGLAFVPFTISPIYSAAKAALHAYSRCLREQLRNSGIRVVELAPPLTETPLFSDEFKEKMPREKGMAADLLVRKAIAGIEAGKTELRPGQSNILKIASRVAPNLIFREMSKVSAD